MLARIKPQRIVFLDLLRALAVIMILEGHTIDLLLLNEYRSDNYLALLMQAVMIGFALGYGKIRFDKFYAKLTIPQSANKPH